MGVLLIKRMNNNNLSLSTNRYSYKPLYRTRSGTLSGIALRIHNIDISDIDDKYRITIKSPESLETLGSLDSYLSDNINNYSPILTDNIFYIYKNPIVNDLIKACTDFIDIRIVSIKNTTYKSYPILYVI